MKNYIGFVLLLLPGRLLAQSPLIEVPLTKVDQYLPKATNQVGTSQSTDLTGFRGIPDFLTEKVLRSSITVRGQMQYEAYLSGKLTKTEWESTKQGLDIDTTLLSKKPIRQRINTLVGTDTQGRRVLIVDANNNQNFGDDRVLYYPMTQPIIQRHPDGRYVTASIRTVYDTLPVVQVHTQAFDGKTVVDRTAWIKLNPYNDGTTYRDPAENRFHLSLLMNEHRTGSASILGEPFNFVVTSGITGMPYNNRQATIYLRRGTSAGSVVVGAGEYRPHQSFVFNNHRIEVAGVSLTGDTLFLADRGPVGNEILRPANR